MDIWQIMVIVVLAALILAWVAVIAYNKGRVSGRLAAEQAASADEDALSLFGDDVPVRSTERRLVEVLPEALLVTDRNGVVQYASPGSVPFGLVSGDRLNSREVEDILTQAATDGGVREREVQLPVNRNSFPATNGRGLEAGQSMPSNTLYLRVRIGDIGDDLYAIFINDMSEQRRFEAVRRDFVTNVSHELKTPAGAISLLAETVTDAADDPDAVRYFSGRISKESARLTELVHHLIDLQKAQSAESVVNARRISALAVARAAINDNQVQADARHINIRLNLNGTLVSAGVVNEDGETDADTEADFPAEPMIMADADAMQTAVKNLIENAIHYSPEHTTVAVGVGERDGKVTIRVVDQGIGIPEKSLDRVFERFYRVDPARSRETGGSGLGLAITKHCVQENGGRISVWSRKGEGSTFTIELPSASADAGLEGEFGSGTSAEAGSAADTGNGAPELDKTSFESAGAGEGADYQASGETARG